MYIINNIRNENSHLYMCLDKPNNPKGMYVKWQCIFQFGKVFVSVDPFKRFSDTGKWF